MPSPPPTVLREALQVKSQKSDHSEPPASFIPQFAGSDEKMPVAPGTSGLCTVQRPQPGTFPALVENTTYHSGINTSQEEPLRHAHGARRVITDLQHRAERHTAAGVQPTQPGRRRKRQPRYTLPPGTIDPISGAQDWKRGPRSFERGILPACQVRKITSSNTAGTMPSHPLWMPVPRLGWLVHGTEQAGDFSMQPAH